jgi:hypothetical protein
MILMGKLKNSEKNLSQCPFAHYKSHMTDLGLCCERLATNCLNHSTAYFLSYFTSPATQRPVLKAWTVNTFLIF